VIAAIEHPGLSVSNLEQSLAFYRDILGCRLVRVIEPRGDERLGVVAGMSGARARIAHLELGGVMLELFEYVHPRGRPQPPDRNQADIGWIHVGFRSDDVRADAARLRERGVELLSDPVEFRPDVWVVYFRGPDGEVCELRQGN
jgi:catechol 2,3-dioxygenase-like lactoylglutathione lyase family enzyme